MEKIEQLKYLYLNFNFLCIFLSVCLLFLTKIKIINIFDNFEFLKIQKFKKEKKWFLFNLISNIICFISFVFYKNIYLGIFYLSKNDTLMIVGIFLYITIFIVLLKEFHFVYKKYKLLNLIK